MRPVVDLTGRRFGRLLVIERAENCGRRTAWRCQCDCGCDVVVSGSNLQNRRSPTKSCGCLQTEIRANVRVKDLTGRHFGKLTVVARAISKNAGAAWLCKCDCDGELLSPRGQCVVRAKHLLSGAVRSCGCTNFRRRVYGMTGGLADGVSSQSPTALSYKSMIRRCCDQSHRSFQHYGARGIKVCHDWLYGRDGWPAFLAFWDDMGTRPPGMSLDRIDPCGNYEPGNCRWATPPEQRRNRRDRVGRWSGR
jgi:hypothetical protein